MIFWLGLSKFHSFVSEKVDETHVNPQEFVDIIREKDCACLGGAISKDTKGEIIPFLDSLDDSASAVDFVTTVANEALKYSLEKLMLIHFVSV